MTNVNANTSSLIASLAVQPGQLGDVAVPAAAGDSSFKALLSIGLDEAPADVAERDEATKEDSQRNQNEAAPAYAVAAYVPVANSLQPDSMFGQAKATAQVDASAEVSEPAAPVSSPAAEMPNVSDRPSESSAKTSSSGEPASPAENTGVAAGGETAERPEDVPVSTSENDTLRAAIADQLGNIGQLLESLIQIMSGGAVVSSSAQVTAQGATDLNANAASLVAGAEIDPAAQRELLKNVVAVVRDLKQALLHVAAEGGGIVVQQQEVSVTQVQVSVSAQQQIGLPEDVTALLDKLNGLLAQLMPSLTVAADSTALTVADNAQLAQLKTDLKNGIATIRTQLEQLSVQNETVYASAFSRFQAQLGVQKAKTDKDASPQGDALLKEMLAIMAKVPVSDKEAVSAASATVAATAATPSVQADKPQLQITTAPFVIAAASATTDGNANAGGQQGGNSQQQVPVNGIAASGATQSSSSSDGTFARAMALNAGRPVPEQVAVHVKMAAANGDSKITIQLDPEDLGKLDIKLNVKADGKTGIVITADNANALNLLQRDAQNLLRALNDAGLQADGSSLSFNLRGDQQNGQQQGNQQMAQNYQNAQPADEDAVLMQAVTRQYTLNLNDGLDITI